MNKVTLHREREAMVPQTRYEYDEEDILFHNNG